MCLDAEVLDPRLPAGAEDEEEQRAQTQGDPTLVCGVINGAIAWVSHLIL